MKENGYPVNAINDCVLRRRKNVKKSNGNWFTTISKGLNVYLGYI